MTIKRKWPDLRYCPRERRQAYILACMLFWSVLSYLGVSRLVLNGAEVEGPSMSPTLQDGQRVLLNLWRYRFFEPQRGDIVVLDVPGYAGSSVKRIVGMPGETVGIAGGVVRVNGRELVEPYLPKGLATPAGGLGAASCRVAPGCYFVLGDNRWDSLDSRRFGAVARATMRGAVIGAGGAAWTY